MEHDQCFRTAAQPSTLHCRINFSGSGMGPPATSSRFFTAIRTDVLSAFADFEARWMGVVWVAIS
jgi:hypothetical protein